MSRKPETASHHSPDVSHLLSVNALELTMVLLRPKNPELAHRLGTTLLDLKAGAPAHSPPSTTEQRRSYSELLQRLDINTIGHIMAELNRAAERALSKDQLYPEAKAIMSQLLQEWADFVEWLLVNSAVERRQYH